MARTVVPRWGEAPTPVRPVVPLSSDKRKPRGSFDLSRHPLGDPRFWSGTIPVKGRAASSRYTAYPGRLRAVARCGGVCRLHRRLPKLPPAESQSQFFGPKACRSDRSPAAFSIWALAVIEETLVPPLATGVSPSWSAYPPVRAVTLTWWQSTSLGGPDDPKIVRCFGGVSLRGGRSGRNPSVVPCLSGAMTGPRPCLPPGSKPVRHPSSGTKSLRRRDRSPAAGCIHPDVPGAGPVGFPSLSCRERLLHGRSPRGPITYA
jgi:hypothetical protein